MIKFKNENYFTKFINEIDDLTSITYEDIIDFANLYKLSYGIVKFDEDKDTLYINTNENECFIQTNGEAIKCRGIYTTLQKDNDFDGMNIQLNKDLEDIFSYMYK